MSIRAQQVGSVVMRTLGKALRELNDPRLEGVQVGVTQVRVPPDLSEAIVSVSVTPERHERRSLAALEHARGHLQAQVGQAARMRTVPRLRFVLDENLKRQEEIFDAIAEGLASEAARDKNVNTNTQEPTTDPPAPGQELRW